MDMVAWIGIPVLAVVLIAGWRYVDRADRADRTPDGATALAGDRTERTQDGPPAWATPPAVPRTDFRWTELPTPPALERPAVRASPLVRRGLIAQTVLGMGVAAFTLSTEAYWPDLFRPLAWASLAVLLVALLLALLPGGRGVLLARVFAVAVIGVALFGVTEHVLANYAAGPADPEFGGVWTSLPPITRWGLAITKGVGAAPTLAPIALGQIALALLLVTVTGQPGRRANQA